MGAMQGRAVADESDTPDQPDAPRPPNRPRITVRRNGPYLVSGGVPVGRTAKVETDHGEPVDWEPFVPLDVTESYELCRCGRSASKPFCDGSHEAAPWDAAETADRRPMADRARTIVGDDIVMLDDRTLCAGAGFCADRATSVWRMIRHAEDPTVRERVRRMVELCPSGALQHAPRIGAEPVEPELAPSVAVVRDGPLWARGEVSIVGADGSTYEIRNRVALCRCGASNNKPFCDGTHREIGFRDG